VRRWKWILWSGGIIVTLVVVLSLIRAGYSHHWTGFGQSKVNDNVQPAKTLWDWLSLLIIPLVLAIGGYWFNHSENSRSQNIADQRAETDQQIAEQRRHDEALQAYLDQIGELLLQDDTLRESKVGNAVRALARARTLALLASWLSERDDDRKRSVLQFLYESELIRKDRSVVDLRDANLFGAFLNDINLSAADLSGAWLGDAKLYRANLGEANLRETWLAGAKLGETKLSRADLSGANLSDADLSDAQITGEQLARVESLDGATMPDGQVLKSDDNPEGPTFEEWLKSKGSGETFGSS
jgi:uncharacterized protein YjbI with pentapeptide repeats